MGLLRRLAESAVEVPSVSAECCVHSRVEVASCTRCITACPHEAWELDDEALAIDTERCDGCGLCVAHCPEGALSQQGSTLSLLSARETVEVACHRAAGGGPADRVPCVNAISLGQIASLYRGGLRELVLHTEDCAQCEHRDERGLIAQTDRFNRVLAQRGLPSLGVVQASHRGPPSARPSAADHRDGPRLSRRSFLRHLAGTLAEATHGAEEVVFAPPGSSFPEARVGDLALYVPDIDPTRCNGCDACTRVCCHNALALEPDGDAYAVRPDLCTGCRLCVDVCDQDAVRVAELTRVGQLRLSLRAGVCRACGARFHRPTTADAPDNLCRICVQFNHQRNLFQVL